MNAIQIKKMIQLRISRVRSDIEIPAHLREQADHGPRRLNPNLSQYSRDDNDRKQDRERQRDGQSVDARADRVDQVRRFSARDVGELQAQHPNREAEQERIEAQHEWVGEEV